MQKMILMGRLGRDAVIKETSTGSRFVALTVADTTKRNNVEKTSWYDVTTFNVERFEKMIPYLTKGSGVVVTGELDASIQSGTDNVQRLRLAINADSIDFALSASSNRSQTAQGTNETTVVNEPVVATVEDVSDDAVVVTKKPSTRKKVEPVVTTVEESSDDDLPF